MAQHILHKNISIPYIMLHAVSFPDYSIVLRPLAHLQVEAFPRPPSLPTFLSQRHHLAMLSPGNRAGHLLIDEQQFLVLDLRLDEVGRNLLLRQMHLQPHCLQHQQSLSSSRTWSKKKPFLLAQILAIRLRDSHLGRGIRLSPLGVPLALPQTAVV